MKQKHLLCQLQQQRIAKLFILVPCDSLTISYSIIFFLFCFCHFTSNQCTEHLNSKPMQATIFSRVILGYFLISYHMRLRLLQSEQSSN